MPTSHLEIPRGRTRDAFAPGWATYLGGGWRAKPGDKVKIDFWDKKTVRQADYAY